MHFTVNLDKKNGDKRALVRLALHAVVAVPAIALTFAVLHWQALERGQAEVGRASVKTDASASDGGINPDQVSEVHGVLARLNQAVGHQGEPVESILLALSDSLPVNVRIEEVSYSAIDATGQLAAVSASDIQLSDFVRKLEIAPPVDRVVVTRQGTVEAGSEGLRRYDVFLAAEQ